MVAQARPISGGNSVRIQVGRQYLDGFDSTISQTAATANTAIINNAYAAVKKGTIWLPGILIPINGAIVPSGGTRLEGAGAPMGGYYPDRGTWIENIGATDIVRFPAGVIYGVEMTGIGFINRPLNPGYGSLGGGHVFNADGSNLGKVDINHIQVTQQVGTKRVWEQDETSQLIEGRFTYINESMAGDQSVDAWKVYSAGGVTNNLVWENMAHFSTAANASVNRIWDLAGVGDSSGLPLADIIIKNINVEQCRAGIARLRSVINFTFEQVNLFDTPFPTTAHIFEIGRYPGHAFQSRAGQFRQCLIHSNNLGVGMVDFKLNANDCWFMTFDQVMTGTATGLTYDLGNNIGTIIRGGHSSDTISNRGGYTIGQRMGEMFSDTIQLGQTGSIQRSGSGVPTTTLAAVACTAGDHYYRTDTPTVANQRIYVCTVSGTPGTWVGVV